MSRHRTLFGAIAATSLISAALIAGIGSAQAAENVTELTQTGCQFLEPEGADHNFTTTKKADCEAINEKTGEARVAKARTLRLKPGKHIFRVTNKNVDYELGFWVRGQGISRALLPTVSGPGLHMGVTQDYEITLKPGKYYYSCPLNTTPDYELIVEEG